MEEKHLIGKNDAQLSEFIINSLPGVFYLYDESGHFLRWNKNFETVTGYPAAEIADMHPLHFFDASEQALLESKIANVFASGSDSVEAHLLTKDKRRIPYFFTGNILQYQGKTCLVGTGIDMAEQKKAEARLAEKIAESEERAKELHCLYRISELLSHSDLPQSEIFRNCAEFIAAGYLHPEHTCARITVDGIPYVTAGFLETSRKQSSEILCSDGPVGILDVFYTADPMNREPFLPEEQSLLDSIADILGSYIERKRAEAKQAFERRDKEALINSTDDLIWSIDTELRLIAANQPFLEGIRKNTGLILNPGDDILLAGALPAEYTQLWESAYRRALAGESFRETNFTPGRDGLPETWIETSFKPILQDGRVIGAACHARDITERKKSDAAILESEEKYRYLFNHNPALIFMWDLQDLSILEVNEVAISTYGYSRDELLAMTVLKLRPEEDWPRIREFAKNFLASGEMRVRKAWRHLKKNGEVLHMDITSHRIDYMGRPAILSLAKDITEQVKAEAEIARSEQRFRDTLDKMLEGVQIIGHDWRYLYLNEAAAKHGRFVVSDLLGKTMMERFPGIDKSDTFHLLEHCMTKRVSRQHIENQFFYPDGTFAWFELSVQPVPEGIFILSIDITERKLAEQEIRNSEEKRELIMNAALDAIICIDTAGNVTFWNPQAENIFGWNESAVLGRLLSDTIIPHRYRQQHRQGMNRYLDSGQSQMMGNLVELTALRANGSEFPIELIVMPVRQGDEHFFCAFIRDITERVDARRELQERNEQLRNLSAYLQTVREEERTHIAREIHDELGQQLTVLKMDVASLRNKLKDPGPEIRQKTEDIVGIADISIQTIRRIITELRPGILDDLGLLAALEWQAKEFEQKTGIRCRFSTPMREDHFPAAINTAVFRIFQESLTNVARHAEATGIEARLVYRDASLVLEIHDNGRGISEIRKNNKTSFGLLGMRERAKMLNGTFDISAAPEGGTTIILKIPYIL